MENEIDNIYPPENTEEYTEENEQNQNEQIHDEQLQEETPEPQYTLPPDFKYTPVKIPRRVDWFAVFLSWIILGALGYVLFTTSFFH
ncbi:hypothetical protein J6P92_03945 [bacterium]|nr:hypothetical protein [bacterium]